MLLVLSASKKVCTSAKRMEKNDVVKSIITFTLPGFDSVEMAQEFALHRLSMNVSNKIR